MTNRITDHVSHTEHATGAEVSGVATLPPTDGSPRPSAARRASGTNGRGSDGRNRKPTGKAAGGTTPKAATKVPPMQSRSKAKPVSASLAEAKPAQAAVGRARDLVVATKELGVSGINKASPSLRQHAIPAALVGAAVGYYLLRTQVARRAEARLLGQAKQAAGAVGNALSGAGGATGDAFTQAAGSTRGAMGSAAESIGHAAGTAAEAIREGAVTLAEFTKSGVASAGDALRSGAGVVGETTVAGYRRGQRAVADSWEHHPLVVGASILAAGLTAGMFLPAPRQSGALLTRASADLSRKMTNKASELLEKGRSAVGLGSATASAPKPSDGKGRQRTRSRPTSA